MAVIGRLLRIRVLGEMVVADDSATIRQGLTSLSEDTPLAGLQGTWAQQRGFIVPESRSPPRMCRLVIVGDIASC